MGATTKRAETEHSTRDKTQVKALVHASTSRPSRRHHAALRRRTTAPTRTKTLKNNLSVVSASHRSSPPLDPAHAGVKPSTRRSAAREPLHRARIGRSLLTQISRRVASSIRTIGGSPCRSWPGERPKRRCVPCLLGLYVCVRVTRRGKADPRARSSSSRSVCQSQVASDIHVCPVLKKTSVFWFVNRQYTHRAVIRRFETYILWLFQGYKFDFRTGHTEHFVLLFSNNRKSQRGLHPRSVERRESATDASTPARPR